MRVVVTGAPPLGVLLLALATGRLAEEVVLEPPHPAAPTALQAATTAASARMAGEALKLEGKRSS